MARIGMSGILGAAAAAMLMLISSASAESAKKKIVFLAGHPSHGSGDHEFNAGAILLAKALNEQSGLAVDVVVHANTWPEDEHAFDGAAAVIMYMDGGGGHPINSHLDQIDALMAKGVGLMCMHYAVEVPAGPSGEQFKKWIGGYYESAWSTNPHWKLTSELNADHPITRGVPVFSNTDEWYYNMRFRDGMVGVTTVLSGVPNDETRQGKSSWPKGPYKHIVEASGRKETVMWAVERPDGGRGVGFTGGHFHRNWAVDGQRTLVLNAMLWVAGMEVPKEGVKSAKLTEADLNENLDAKKNMKHVSLPE